MQIAHARAHKELKWSFITYVQVLTFHILSSSVLFFSRRFSTSFDVDSSIDFPTLASASTQLRKRFRSGRRSSRTESPSARQRSSAPQIFDQKSLKLFPRAGFFAFLWPVTPSSWSSCTSFWSELRRCKPAEVNKVKACWCWQAVFVSTKEFRWPCLWMFLNLCQDSQHILGAGIGRACLLLNTLSFMFTPKIISLKSWTGSKHM